MASGQGELSSSLEEEELSYSVGPMNRLNIQFTPFIVYPYGQFYKLVLHLQLQLQVLQFFSPSAFLFLFLF